MCSPLTECVSVREWGGAGGTKEGGHKLSRRGGVEEVTLYLHKTILMSEGGYVILKSLLVFYLL